MSNKREYPTSLNRSKGVINGASNFYRGDSVVLNTAQGELVLIASSTDTIRYASDLIMPAHFSVDTTMAQDVAIFGANHVIECDDVEETIASQAETITKQQEQVELLREALKRLSGSGVDFMNAEDLEDEEDRATMQSNFNDLLMLADEAIAATDGE